MRATGFSNALLLLAALVAGCAHTRLVGTERGDVLSRQPVREYVAAERVALQVSGAGRAQVETTRTHCVELATEYETVAVNAVESDSGTLMTWLGVGLVIAGGTLLAMALTDESEEGAPTSYYLAGAVGVGAGLPLALSDNDESARHERVRLPETETDHETRCEDDTRPHRGALDWELVVAGKTLEGTTDETGVLSVPNLVALQFERQALEEAALRRVVSSSRISYRLKLGPSDAEDRLLETRLLPDGFFERVARRYDETLSGDERGRWDNCRIIAKSAREAFECLWSQG